MTDGLEKLNDHPEIRTLLTSPYLSITNSWHLMRYVPATIQVITNDDIICRWTTYTRS